ncbi:MAG: DUF2807 domain-containing protein [Chitinophagaceae bacterium]|nr:MAG: DUF2807 domain-containing protein [Chitinophagaceae bacterium]
MKKHILFLILPFVVFLSSCDEFNEQRIVGNGVVTKNVHDVGGFSAINASSSMDVTVKQSDRFKVEVETDENLQEVVSVYEMDSTLYLKLKEGFSIRSSGDTKIYVEMPVLKKLKASGVVDVETDGKFNQRQGLDISLSGASEADLQIRTPHIEVKVSGAGSVKIKGETKDINLKASGASNINTYDLLAETVIANATGASHIKTFGSVLFNFTASGASSIEYKGEGAVEKSKSSGASNIKASEK